MKQTFCLEVTIESEDPEVTEQSMKDKLKVFCNIKNQFGEEISGYHFKFNIPKE